MGERRDGNWQHCGGGKITSDLAGKARGRDKKIKRRRPKKSEKHLDVYKRTKGCGPDLQDVCQPIQAYLMLRCMRTSSD